MDWQPKVRPQAASVAFADGVGMRTPVEGTVAKGELREDERYFQGTEGGVLIARSPVPATLALARRGQQRFDIYCAPCHDRAGSGKGIVVQRGYPPPMDLAGDRVRGLADGEIFRVISSGVRNMPGYAAQIPVGDRWAIVLWVRALGRSQHAALADVPPDLQNNLAPEGAR
jgi:mono/diheme cytochrome c family protein